MLSPYRHTHIQSSESYCQMSNAVVILLCRMWLLMLPLNVTALCVILGFLEPAQPFHL